MSFERKLKRRNITPISKIRKQCVGKCSVCKWYVNNVCTFMVVGRGRKGK